MKNAGVFNVVLLVAFIALIYFMMIRPQRKRDKEVSDMRASLKPGDQIVTIGGIVGKVVRIKDDRILIETGSGKTKMEIVKTAVGSVVGKQAAEKLDDSTSEKEAEPEIEETHVTEAKRLLLKSLELKSQKTRTVKPTNNSELKRCAAAHLFLLHIFL